MTGLQAFCVMVVILILVVLAWKIGFKLLEWELKLLAIIFKYTWPFIVIGIIGYGIWSLITCVL